MRDVDNDRATEAKDAPQPLRDRRLGLICLMLATATVVLGAFLILSVRFGSQFGLPRPDLVTGLILFLAGVVCLWLGVRLGATGHKLRTRDANTVIAETGSVPVLYLRSFALDTEDGDNAISFGYGVNVPINPWEASVAAGIAGAGPLVAIGRPGEKLATTGASRVYVTDDEWQDKVRELAEQAQLVIWVYGRSEGLRWEIEHLAQALPPEKLILALPYWDAPKRMKSKLWEDAVADIGHALPKGLPDHMGDSLYVTFGPDWTPHRVIARPPPLIIRFAMLGGWNRITHGLRTLLADRQLYVHRYGALTQFLCFLAGVIWIGLIGIILAMFYGLFVVFSR